MSALLDPAKLKTRLGRYATGTSASILDPTLLPKIQAYRRNLGMRMSPLDEHGMHHKLPDARYHVSRKIDGEFAVLVLTPDGVFLVNPGGTVRTGLDLADEASAALRRAGITSALVAGELYALRPDGRRPRVHDVSPVVRRPEDDAALARLRFAPFDLVELDGAPVTSSFDETWDTLSSAFGDTELVRPVETRITDTRAEIADCYRQWVREQDAEGLVLRSDSAGIFKVKPRHTLDVVVIGFAESVDDREGMLHDLLVAVVRDDGAFHVAGHVGGGFSDEQRRGFLSDLHDLAVESEYTEVNKDRVAYRMVRPQWVAEVSCLDLVAQNTRGASIDRMVLEWDGDAWHALRRMPLASLISPHFLRLRDDKLPGPDTTGIRQLADIIEIEALDRTAADLVLPRSELLRREVATKTLKGNTMVRKLLMWKTNKERHDDSFPAFVVHLTDFSPNRKDPLKREIRVSSDRQQIDQLWDQLREQYFVSGWNPPQLDRDPA